MSKFLFLLTLVLLLIISLLFLKYRLFLTNEPDAAISGKLLYYQNKVKGFAPDKMDSVVRYADSALLLFNAHATADSVKTSWLQIKVDALLALGLMDSANKTMISAHNHAILEKNLPLQAYTFLWLGSKSRDGGKYFQAEKYISEGLSLAKKSGDKYLIARAHNLFGTILNLKGKYREAQEHLIIASSIFEKLSMPEALGPVYNNIASNYDAINDKEKALDYFKKSLALTLVNHDTLNYVSTLNNLGIHYQNLRPDSAEYYFKEALKCQDYPDVGYKIILTKFNLANLYFTRREFARSEVFYNEIIGQCQAKGIFSGIARCYNGIGNLYEARNDNVHALDSYKRAYHIADSIGETPVAMAFLGNMQYMYEKAGDTKEALVLQKKITSVNDSLRSLEKQIAVHDLEMLYNKEKTERENEALSVSIQLQKNTIRIRTIILILFLVFFAGLVILLWNTYNLYKQRDEAYNTLFKKYKEELILQGETNTPENVVPVINISPTTDSENQLFVLMNYFETQKPFLNPKLKIEDLATATKMSRKSIESMLKIHKQTTFNAFVNNYRITEAKRMLTDDKYNNLKIETIAKDAGFGSKVNFYAAFKQIIGTKPAHLRDNKTK